MLHRSHQQSNHLHLHQAPIISFRHILYLRREVLPILTLPHLQHFHLVQRIVAQPAQKVLEVYVPTRHLKGPRWSHCTGWKCQEQYREVCGLKHRSLMKYLGIRTFFYGILSSWFFFGRGVGPDILIHAYLYQDSRDWYFWTRKSFLCNDAKYGGKTATTTPFCCNKARKSSSGTSIHSDLCNYSHLSS